MRFQHRLRASRIPRLVFLTVVAAMTPAVVACPSPGAGSADAADDSVTQRERYEAVGRSGLPGAQGVQGAQDATDDIRDREAQRDSVLRDQ